MRRAPVLQTIATVIAAVAAAWAQESSELRRVPQVWASSGVEYGHTDSLAAARLADGSVRIFATAEKKDRIDVFDAGNGAWIASFGESGKGPGQFKQPSGVAVAHLPGGDGRSRAVVLVVERDNRRVQAVWADGLASAGTFGETELRRPLGIAVAGDGDGALVFVTDARAANTERVRVYRLWRTGDALQAKLQRNFGEADGPGLLRAVESIAVDERERRVLVCDEDRRQKNVKVYDFDGRFTGTVFGERLVRGAPDGLVVCERAAGGAVIVTDRQPDGTVWYVFDRVTYEWRDTFVSQSPIANTDGIAVFEEAFGGFERGAFFAVNDDQDIRAYALADALPNGGPGPTGAPTASAPASAPAPTTRPAPVEDGGPRPVLRPGDVLDRIAFGSCVRQDREQPIWEAIVTEKPDVFILLGDNIYADTEDVAEMAAKYAQLGAHPGFRKLRSACPLLATWDDHDYGRNDAGAEYPLKRASQQQLLDFFGDPADSPRRRREGVYDAHVFGPPGRRVQIILLDTRYFRSPLATGPAGHAGDGRLGLYVPNDDPAATILGAAQWQWLAEQLAVPAEIRIIASSIQVVAEDQRFEKWMNLPRERERLFGLIREKQAGGVIFLSGDRHLAELSRMDAGVGYDVYDVTSSSLNQPSRQWYNELNRHRWGSNYREPNFGLISIDWDAADPLLTLEIRQVDGAPAIWHPVHLSALQPAR